MKEKLAINFGKYYFGPKTPFHWKKCFSLHLGPFLKCFEWKYCAVSENVFSMSFIYLHFSHFKFLLFLWIYWVRFIIQLAKGPILELPAWTAKSAKSKSLIYAGYICRCRNQGQKKAFWLWREGFWHYASTCPTQSLLSHLDTALPYTVDTCTFIHCNTIHYLVLNCIEWLCIVPLFVS